MWLKAQNEMAGFWPHAAMGPVERPVRPHLWTAADLGSDGQARWQHDCARTWWLRRRTGTKRHAAHANRTSATVQQGPHPRTDCAAQHAGAKRQPTTRQSSVRKLAGAARQNSYRADVLDGCPQPPRCLERPPCVPCLDFARWPCRELADCADQCENCRARAKPHSLPLARGAGSNMRPNV